MLPRVTGLPKDLVATAPPASLEALLEHATRLGGVTLGSLAELLAVPLADTSRHKGGAGQLLELALGADAGSLPAPDFSALGVELKTIPTDAAGTPRESTWVCTASSVAEERWQTSRVRQKLACVLFMPIETAPGLADADRRIGRPVLFAPDEDEEATLRADWEDLAELLALGLFDAVSARRGTALQLRPKARDASVQVTRKTPDGETFQASPRGFYLRRSFTTAALARRLAC
jgi:DNA mismatch repair protein MutH